MDIAIVAYDNMAALDAIGPFEVFANVPDATVTIRPASAVSKRSSNSAVSRK